MTSPQSGNALLSFSTRAKLNKPEQGVRLAWAPRLDPLHAGACYLHVNLAIDLGNITGNFALGKLSILTVKGPKMLLAKSYIIRPKDLFTDGVIQLISYDK